MTPDEKRAYDRAYYANMDGLRKLRKQTLQNDRRLAMRKAISDYKASHGCSCGEDHPACLDFHHMDSDKEVNVSDAIRCGWSINRLMKEIQKCIVMCANCHRKLHHDLRVEDGG